MGRERIGMALLSLLLGLCAVAGSPGAAHPPWRPDVVLVVVDTLRVDRLRALAPRLPYLSRLRARAAVFEHTLSASSWTPTATASIFTGLWPLQHGVRAGHMALTGARISAVDRLPPQASCLPAVLHDAGYRTLGVSDNVNIGPTMGFDCGFDRFVTLQDAGAVTLSRAAARLLRESPADDERPRFVYLHPMDPHAPYVKRAGYRAPRTPKGAALARYDSEIVHLDRQLAWLHAEAGFDDDTLFIFTADHGEAFGEHGSHGHPNQLFQELLAVPLWWHAPGTWPARSFDERVSTVDVLPTLRGLLGLPRHADDAGIDLSGALRRGERPPPRALHAERYSDFLRPPLRRRAVVAEGYKLIAHDPGGRLSLFDLTADPDELRDLSTREPARLARMHALLERAESFTPRYEAERLPPPDAENAALLEKLRALGYAQ